MLRRRRLCMHTLEKMQKNRNGIPLKRKGSKERERGVETERSTRHFALSVPWNRNVERIFFDDFSAFYRCPSFGVSGRKLVDFPRHLLLFMPPSRSIDPIAARYRRQKLLSIRKRTIRDKTIRKTMTAAATKIAPYLLDLV